ncbi:hypothetical protein FRC07_008530, partial [Ceratobasidium sp. 392]
MSWLPLQGCRLCDHLYQSIASSFPSLLPQCDIGHRPSALSKEGFEVEDEVRAARTPGAAESMSITGPGPHTTSPADP